MLIKLENDAIENRSIRLKSHLIKIRGNQNLDHYNLFFYLLRQAFIKRNWVIIKKIEKLKIKI